MLPPPWEARVLFPVLLSLTAFVCARTEATGAPADLNQLLSHASFKPVSEETLHQSRARLVEALGRRPAKVSQEEWDYLRTDSVADAFRTDNPDRRMILDNLIAKLSQDFSPYENSQLLELRRLARRHLVSIDLHERPEYFQQAFEEQRAALLLALADYQTTGTREAHRRLASGILWMQDHALAMEFVEESRKQLSFPNLEIYLPANLLHSVSNTHFPTQVEPIDRTSDGITTRGTGILSASAYLAPAHSATLHTGRLGLQFSGQFTLDATNTRERIQFQSRATTNTAAVAAITLDNQCKFSVDDLRVCSSSRVCSGPACVNRRIGRRVIGRVVDRVVHKKTPEIEQALSREITERVEKELGTQLQEFIDKANTAIEEKLWWPMRRLDLNPRQISVETTSEHVRLSVLEDRQGGLAAPRPFGHRPQGLGVAAVHASLVTDLLNILYVRRKQPAELDGDLMQRLNASLPIPVFAEVDFPEETRLTFVLDFPRPFSISFAKNTLQLTMRSERIEFDDTRLPGRDLTLAYRLVVDARNQLRLQLAEEPHLSAPQSDGSADPPELMQTIRNELLAGLLPELVFDVSDVLGEDQSLPVAIAGLTAQDQWLVLSLDSHRDSQATQGLITTAP